MFTCPSRGFAPRTPCDSTICYHPKNVHENSPKRATSGGQKCPLKLTKKCPQELPFEDVHERSHILKKKCPLEVIVPEMSPSPNSPHQKFLIIKNPSYQILLIPKPPCAKFSSYNKSVAWNSFNMVILFFRFTVVYCIVVQLA